MAQHTPGGWIKRGNRILDNQEYEIAIISKRVHSEGNGNLIVAAPEMLEGLEKIRIEAQKLSKVKATCSLLGLQNRIIEIIDEAIAKAEAK